MYENWCRLKDNGAHYEGKCWLPKESEEKIKNCLAELSHNKPHVPAGYLEEIPKVEWEGRETPPTYFETNYVTATA